MTNDFIYMNRCLRSTLVFFCWLQYIWDLKYQSNTCAGHHYQKGLHGSWYYNLTMLPSHTYMFGYLFIFNVFFFFLMWTIFEDFIEFVTKLLLFYALVFWPWGMWYLSSPTGDWTCSPCIGKWSLNPPGHQGSPVSTF